MTKKTTTNKKTEPYIHFKINGEKKEIVGTIDFLKGIERDLSISLGAILEQCLKFSIEQMATVVRRGLMDGDSSPSITDVENAIMNEVGYGETKLLIFELLTLATTVPKERAEAKKNLKEALAVLR